MHSHKKILTLVKIHLFLYLAIYLYTVQHILSERSGTERRVCILNIDSCVRGKTT